MDSIRRIKSSQLTTGMYLTELGEQLAQASGLKARGLVTRDETVNLVQQSGVTELYIDIAKGSDCADSEPVPAAVRAQLSAGPTLAEPASFAAELKNASDVRDKALNLIQEAMQDVKMGRGFDTGAVDVITTEVIQSLDSNQNALTSLMRLRNMDSYLLEHSTNVAVLMGILAKSLGVNRDELHQLVFGAFVHDVGKILVPEQVLNKPGRLDATEWQEMKRHVDYGVDSLKTIDGITGVAMEICEQHHERLDGTGYPYNLSAEQISAHGRMAAVVDVYDAVTANRVYHAGIEPSVALKRMLEWTGTHLDRELVYQLIRCISVYPAGAWVMLSSGLVALVQEPNLKKPTRAKVLLVYDSKRRVKLDEQVVDLVTSTRFGEIKFAVSPIDYQLDIGNYLKG
ncbi:HD-GYP domain-containing protein [Pseudomaricurvus alcaniphilus]|uniref:HD-GYP domain-containing protein n=1 Tax=Pseudomaricurvus alcaniphilus TaxID=1166482 RepID=UPI00140C5F6C|nr:HD-GYP domain-containing protein [Pseudomaricurvus alcaniphilus]NHN39641.1 HD-GYP domain-containing protein [Pseudomaricurvus alcaniphilus]